MTAGEGNLTDIEVLANQRTGEMETVTVFRNPRTGAKTAPGPGWNYNPGQTPFAPDPGKYDPDIAKLW